jgi:Predicted flavin-nucleotide-binding protein
MFQEMRRKDRSMDNEKSIGLLEKGQYGILSTVGENGYTYGVPLNYTYNRDNIYFHCAEEGYKLKNILYNNKVSFCVVGNTAPIPEKFSYKFESVVVFGKAEEVSGIEKEEALVSLVKKYSNEFVDKGLEYIRKDSCKTKVVKITIDHMTGKTRM